MKKIIIVSLFFVALLIPLAVSTSASASTENKIEASKDFKPDISVNDDGSNSDAPNSETTTSSLPKQNDESNTTTTSTTTTSIPTNENGDANGGNDAASNDPNTSLDASTLSNCINAQINDNGKTFMGIAEKELVFKSTCRISGDSNTTVLAFFFYGYDYKTIERLKETTSTIYLNAPMSSPVNALSSTTSTTTTKPLVAFPINTNNSLLPVAAPTQPVALGQVDEPVNNSSSFSVPFIFTSLGSILIYGIKKRLLLPF